MRLRSIEWPVDRSWQEIDTSTLIIQLRWSISSNTGIMMISTLVQVDGGMTTICNQDDLMIARYHHIEVIRDRAKVDLYSPG